MPLPLPGGSTRPAPRHGDALLLPHHRSLFSRFLTGFSHTFPGWRKSRSAAATRASRRLTPKAAGAP